MQVTVDVKTDKSGKITRVFASIEDNVAVGSELFELQEGAYVASESAAAAPAPAQEQAAQPPAAAHGRTPSIQFKGKRSLLQAAPAVEVAAPTAATVSTMSTEGHTSQFRLAISADEMDAVDSGFMMLN